MIMGSYELKRFDRTSDWEVDGKMLEERYDRVRAFLHAEGLGALIVYSPPVANMWGQTGHVAYLSGWGNLDRMVDTVVVVPVEGSPVLLYAGMPFMEENISHVSPMKDVRLVQAVDPNAVAMERSSGGESSRDLRSFASETLSILRAREIFDKGIGVVGISNMPLPFFDALSREIGDNLCQVDDIVAKLRAVKVPAELELLRHSAHLGDLGFEAMMEVAKPGMRGIEIIAEMERAARREGADHAKFWMASGPPTTWEDSRLELKPHERVLGDGDFVQVCSYIVYRGYWSHGQRTGTMGRTSEYLDGIARIAREAQDAGIAVMKPDVPAGSIAKAVQEKVSESGWGLQGGRVGHGCGLDYSERPIPFGGNDEKLQIGNTIILHSAFSLPGSGKLFVPLGDQIHLTENGPEFLMKFPRTLFNIGV